MATLLLQAAGAALGGALGPVGAAIGTAAGAMAGYVIDRSIINGLQHIEGPRLAGAAVHGRRRCCHPARLRRCEDGRAGDLGDPL